MACTSPRRTRRAMSRLATTPGKRLVMPRSSTAYGAPAPPCGASVVAIGPPRCSPATPRTPWGARCGSHSAAIAARERRLGAQACCAPSLRSATNTSRCGGHRDLAGLDLVRVLHDKGLAVEGGERGGGGERGRKGQGGGGEGGGG